MANSAPRIGTARCDPDPAFMLVFDGGDWLRWPVVDRDTVLVLNNLIDAVRTDAVQVYKDRMERRRQAAVSNVAMNVEQPYNPAPNPSGRPAVVKGEQDWF